MDKLTSENLCSKIYEIIPKEMTLGFCILDEETGTEVEINAYEKYPLASVAKFVSVVIALKLNKNIDSQLIKDSISVHSQKAFEQVLEIVNVDDINKELLGLGLDINIDRDNTNPEKNIGTPAAISSLLRLLYKGELLDSEDRKNILNALELQEDPDGFRLKKTDNSKWLHMTGGLKGLCNDIGYFQLGNQTIICSGFMKSNSEDIEWSNLEKKMQEVGNLIFEYYSK